MQTKQRRAEPLPPDDRRRAIVEAVIPLLVKHGAAVTTRQMAEAAGIAEGTIFGVFANKTALIHEAVKVCMDPAPVRTALAGIPSTDSIETQLAEAARILLDHFGRVTVLVGVLRTMPTPTSGPPAGARRYVAESHATVLAALTDLLTRHQNRLRIEPARAAAAFQGLIFARLQPLVAPNEKLTIEEIVGILLSGIADPTKAVT
ncbi:MAG: TetR/AcrR family transcriptional regulator [Acidimicrobiia bacterium]|nr:TetR/AcrR family transcriptional regulator [Acidimicrobiia bacterium]